MRGGMDRDQERALVDGLIRRIVQECPRRQAASDSERHAQQIVREVLNEAGVASHLHKFEFNDNIHQSFVLHFGLGTLGTLLGSAAPRTAFALHAGSALSYWADSSRRAYLLRRLLPFKPSQNLVGVLPADGEPTLRIVFVAHVDAAFSGLVFDPQVVRIATKPLPGVGALRPIALATRAQVALAGIDLLRAIVGPLALPLRPLEYLLTLPSALILLANLDILLRNEIVPGANDDLTGVASLCVLAHRLGALKPPDVELVFVASGAEEASLGGADALARDMDGIWDKQRTVVLALDTLSLGDLRFIDVEGDVEQKPIPGWLRDLIVDVAGSDARFAGIRPFRPPLGGTDAGAFLAQGWNAVGLTCIDPELGAAGNYHQPSDAPDALDLDEVLLAVDFAEALAQRLIEERRTPR